jgi:capsule biosynthesis phosphatase
VRICIDLDGVICQLRGPGQTYADVDPVPGAVDNLRAFRAAGHTIIIFTARHMKTCAGNVGLVTARMARITLDWLDRHGVPFDEIHFGKPHADVYIDDNAFRFASWEAIGGKATNLPRSAESLVAGSADLTVIVPMAGRGSRFTQAGVQVPKPLIDVLGRPMYTWALDSLPLRLTRHLIFVCLREHLEATGLGADIRDRYGQLSPTIVPLDATTEGQACTVLAARAHIDLEKPLLIYNADTYCRTNLDTMLPGLAPSIAGVLGVFRAAGDQWSFVRVDGAGRVVETAEKRRISEWASTGLYHFRRAADFVAHADAMITDDDRTRGEFYVAPVYNRLLASGADIRIDEATEFWPLGTPEELARFKQRRASP